MDIDPTAVRVHPVAVGGMFGVRGELYPEDFLVPLAARRVGESVAWAEDRIDHTAATNHHPSIAPQGFVDPDGHRAPFALSPPTRLHSCTSHRRDRAPPHL